MKYRVVRELIDLNTGHEYEAMYRPEFIERFLVQVKGLFFWHTVKSFKRLITAVRLLKHLQQPTE